ncbi:MAG: hypothetical protein AAF648_05525 [Pseudomonadota bacterium]
MSWTPRQQQVLARMGINVWQDRSEWLRTSLRPPNPPAQPAVDPAPAVPSAVRELMDWATASAPNQSRKTPSVDRATGVRQAAVVRSTSKTAASAAGRTTLEGSLALSWTGGVLLLSDDGVEPRERRLLGDIVRAVAALRTVDLGAPSHRPALGASQRLLGMGVSGADFPEPAVDAVRGFFRKRLTDASAHAVLVATGGTGTAARWFELAGFRGSFEAANDPALAALGSGSIVLTGEDALRAIHLPPAAVLLAEPGHKRRLWQWLSGLLGP